MELITLMKQDLRNILTNPTIILFCMIYPISLVLVFGFLFSDMYGSGNITSYDYYGVTMLFYLVLTSATITPTVFMEERIKKANVRIAYAPISRVQIYSSKLIVTTLFLGLGFFTSMVILNGFKIVNFGGENFGKVLLLYGALLIFTVTLGGAICTIVKREDLTNKVMGSIINTFAILSGIFFPIAQLRKICRTYCKLYSCKNDIRCNF